MTRYLFKRSRNLIRSILNPLVHVSWQRKTTQEHERDPKNAFLHSSIRKKRLFGGNLGFWNFVDLVEKGETDEIKIKN